MVSALDESVRQIVTTLKKKGLYDNSIIIFTTDNGAAAGGLDASAGSNYPLRGSKNTLWEGGVRGVGFVHSPLIKKRGTNNISLQWISDMNLYRFEHSLNLFFPAHFRSSFNCLATWFRLVTNLLCSGWRRRERSGTN